MKIPTLDKYGLSYEKVLEIIQPHKEDIVFISGSIAEGFSNEGSDVDIYIITKEGYEGNANTHVKEFSYGVEYTFLGYECLISAFVINEDMLYNIIYNIEEKIKSNQLVELNNKLIELYHRLYRGISLQNNQEFVHIKNKLDFEGFKMGLSKNRLVYSENRHDDAIGALNSNDLLTAFISSKVSLEKSVDGLLCAHGETNPSDKWLFKRLLSIYRIDCDWVKEFIDLYTGENKLVTLEEKTKEMLRLANLIRMKGYQLIK